MVEYGNWILERKKKPADGEGEGGQGREWGNWGKTCEQTSIHSMESTPELYPNLFTCQKGFALYHRERVPYRYSSDKIINMTCLLINTVHSTQTRVFMSNWCSYGCLYFVARLATGFKSVCLHTDNAVCRTTKALVSATVRVTCLTIYI